MIKLVATDIDGTILPKTREFSSGVKNCISKLQESGVKVVLVTGRMHEGAKRISDELNLKTPVVSYNGGLIKTFDDEILYEKDMPSCYVEKIIDWARENDVHLNLYSDDVLYSEKDDDEIKQYAQYQRLGYKVKNFSEISYDRIHKLLAIDYKDADRVSSWVDEMSEKFPDLYIIKSTPYFCEFSTPDATKAKAVKFLQKYWDLKDEEILTIGDQDNDIELLKAGGIRVAMGNATEGLKACANYITDSIDNDGFVKAIEKFVFKGEAV